MKELKVKTPVGIISTEKKEEKEAQGVWLKINGKKLVLIEYDKKRHKNFVRIWTRKQEERDECAVMVQLEKAGEKVPDSDIVAQESTDIDYPGIWVSVNDQNVVLLDYNSENDRYAVRVWTLEQDRNGEDYGEAVVL